MRAFVSIKGAHWCACLHTSLRWEQLQCPLGVCFDHAALEQHGMVSGFNEVSIVLTGGMAGLAGGMT